MLAVLLGVAAASPVHQPAAAGGGARGSTRRVFGTIGNLAGQNSLRNPRRTTATASALMIGLTLACTMAIVGDSAKAIGRPDDRGELRRRLRRQQRLSGEPFSPRSADEMAGRRRRRARWCGSASAIARASTADAQGVGATDPATTLDGPRARRGRRRRSRTWPTARCWSRRDLRRRRRPRGRRRRRRSRCRRRARDLAGRRPLRGEPGRRSSRCSRRSQTLIDAGFPDADNFLVVDADRTPPALAGRASTRWWPTCRSSPSRTRRPSPPSSASRSTSWC